jgi:hypothetical protein
MKVTRPNEKMIKQSRSPFDNDHRDRAGGQELNRLFPIWGVHIEPVKRSNPRISRPNTFKAEASFGEASLDAPLFSAHPISLYQQRDNLGLDAKQMRLLTPRHMTIWCATARCSIPSSKRERSRSNRSSRKLSTFSSKVLADEETYVRSTMRPIWQTCR